MRLTKNAAFSLIDEIHAADHALDVDRFVKLLTPTVRLQIGSQPELYGHAAVRAAISGLFSSLGGVKHHLKDLWVGDHTVIFQAEVTYLLKDARVVRLPYVDVLSLAEQGLIEDYRIYIDLAPLMSALAQGGDASP